MTAVPQSTSTALGPCHTLAFKGPRGKLPFIVDQSQSVPDSGNILPYLKTKYGGSARHRTPRKHFSVGCHPYLVTWSQVRREEASGKVSSGRVTVVIPWLRSMSPA
ncbi:glutathione S-transferase N-terminal domain-containing protein [Halomonas daqiaonensis]|uniref:glutathione S-transferase N-terminal domain-containing protein n=1 Tax=Halomonas daqiaonensis TaxID=650850 RepID=UPI0011140380